MKIPLFTAKDEASKHRFHPQQFVEVKDCDVPVVIWGVQIGSKQVTTKYLLIFPDHTLRIYEEHEVIRAVD